MTTTVRLAEAPAYRVSECLLGQNIEMCLDLAPGLLSERLDNPFFFGPGNWQSRIADGWQPARHYGTPGMRFELTPGMALSPWQSQLLHNFSGREDGICQIGRYIRKGEKLRVTLWARVQSRPASLRVSLRPLQASLPDYSQATIEITSAYWKGYEAVLDAPADDDAAVFSCVMPAAGMVYLDQIHLCPQDEGHLRRQVVQAIDAMHIGPLRFPGGHASCDYHWRHGTGPLHRRAHLPDVEFRFPEGMRYDFGTDEYLGLCRDLKIVPQITVNIGTGTPEEAGDWAAYCWNWWKQQGLQPPAMYWQIGNETYLVQEIGNCTPEMYVQTLREYVPLIRKAYPSARMIIMGQESYSSADPGNKPWRAPVLDQAPPDLYDLVDVHHYAKIRHDIQGPARQEALVSAAQGMANAVVKADADLKARGLDKAGKTLAITEWNLWHWASHHDGKGFYERYDVEHALFTATMVHHWVRMGRRLELANFYNLLNVMGIILAKGPKFQVTCVADVFRLYRPAFPATVLATEIDCPALAGGAAAALDAICLRAGAPGGADAALPNAGASDAAIAPGTYVLLVNRDARQALEVELPGQLGRPVETVMMTGKDPFDEAMPTAPAGPAQGKTIHLPPLSIARVKMAK